MPSGQNSGTLPKNALENTKNHLDICMIKNIIAKLLFTGLIVSFTSACSGDDEYLFEHGPAGPNTKKTLNNLPEGLLPDNSKASHTSETLEPDQ